MEAISFIHNIRFPKRQIFEETLAENTDLFYICSAFSLKSEIYIVFVFI